MTMWRFGFWRVDTGQPITAVPFVQYRDCPTAQEAMDTMIMVRSRYGYPCSIRKVYVP